MIIIASHIQAAIINVPGNYATIQQAIDAASNGDTVLVFDGVYTGSGNVNLDFKGKAITVKSKNGHANCVIDCENIANTRGFYFYTNETPNSILDGFTIQNGMMDNGAGIHCYSSSPTIRNNIIRSCASKFSKGGGICCVENSAPEITSNIIIENSAYYGGGVYCDSSDVIINNNVISKNSATYGGGVCFLFSSSSEMLNNNITKNSAYRGGGIYFYSSSSQVVNNTIASNSAQVGGGIFCRDDSNITLINTILWNDSPQEVWFHESDGANELDISYSDIENGQSGIVTNSNGTLNWLSGNIAEHPVFAGVPYDDYHLSDLSPCIGAGTSVDAPPSDIEGNSRGTPPDMGAYENSLDDPLIVVTLMSPNGGESWYSGSTHDIIWSALGPGIDHIRLLYSTDGGTTYPDTIIAHTDNNGAFLWTLPVLNSSTVKVKIIAEDISNNPLAEDTSDSNFIITNMDTTAPQTSIFLSGEQGENNWWIADVTVKLQATDDLSGVKKTTYKINNGSWLTYVEPFVVKGSTISYKSEDNASNLEAEKSYLVMIDKTDPSKPIVADDGSYTSIGNSLHASWSSEDKESGIAEYQYAIGTGTGKTDVVDWTSAGMQTQVTVSGLSLTARNVYYFAVKAKNLAGFWSSVGNSNGISYNPAPIVIYVPGNYATIQTAIDNSVSGDTVLVADGVYKGSSNINLDFKGKAITLRSENGSKYCIIDCENQLNTRGFYFHTGEDSEAVLEGFTIQNGMSDRGGGIYLSSSSPSIIDVVVKMNLSNLTGGGIYGNSSSSSITNSVIMDNSSNYSCGGGLYFAKGSVVITNSIIAGNSAQQGGGICCDSSTLEVVNCTIEGNSAYYGGGFSCHDGSIVEIVNTILWNDDPEEISLQGTTGTNNITISYSDIKNGQAGIIIGGKGAVSWLGGNINADPLFVSSQCNDYHLTDFSPCIGAGTTDDVMPALDIEGNARPEPSGSNPDIGAYENNLGLPLPLSPLIVEALSPVDIIVTDPSGRTINKNSSQIPSATYIEVDLDGDSDLDDKVNIPDALIGLYLIQVIPEEGAAPTETYTLKVTHDNKVTKLAEDVQIQSIPADPYKYSTSPYIFVLDLLAGKNMVSCPGEPYVSNITALVSGTPVQPYAYTWNPESGIYEDASSIEFGKGYVFVADQDTQLVIHYQPRNTLTRPIKKGWNMVGSISQSVSIDLMDSDPPGEILPHIYIWNPRLERYDLVNEIKPGLGHWLAAISDTNLNINSNLSPTRPSMDIPLATRQKLWESILEINSYPNSMENQKLVFGMYDLASEGFDKPLDRPVPPPMYKGPLGAYWTISDPSFPNLDKSFVGANSNKIWKFSIELTAPGEIQWKQLPDTYNFLLHHNGEVIQIKNNSVIALPAGKHTFDIKLEDFDMRPNRSRLLANYPNPFNPETWIPYELSEDTNVEISIYNLSGRIVRTLNLGHKPAGFYTEKVKAAYWDGKNEAGESVASGIYFYSIKAGEFLNTRKMAILR